MKRVEIIDIKINIEQELWESIEKNYANESYSSAILDAMHLLTATIRNKTGLEGDGSSLVGQAFGGENPKLQINKLQTESEKNIQRGTQEILKGLYTAIRNPRSHDKFNDSKEEADSIIYFIGYLLKIIDKSKMNFDESTFLTRVFDDFYVKTEEYSKLLVNEIPKRQRTNIAISIILQRKNGDIYNLSYFFKALSEKLDENGISQVYKVISDELKYTSKDEDIRTILKIAPAKYWGKLDKAVKIRIENMLLDNVKIGDYDKVYKKCRFGALGTWIEEEHIENFENIDSWIYEIVKKMKNGDDEEKAYIELYFWNIICRLNRENINFWLLDYLNNGLKNGDEKIIKLLEEQITYQENHPWWNVFEKELKNYPHIEYCVLPF
jgi:uncharacterized protein (TIGR02391 family)